MANGKLGSASLLASTNTVVYKVPVTAAFSTINILILNPTAADIVIRIALSETVTPQAKDYIEYNTILIPSGVLERTSIICSPNENVIIFSNISGAVVRINGLEESL